MDLYNTGCGSHVCKMNIPRIDDVATNVKSGSKNVHTIIILDISVSMASFVKKVVTNYIPSALKRLGYVNEKITLITFSTNSYIYSVNIDDFKTLPISAFGLTYMQSAIDLLREAIITSSSKKIRILTISDGEVFDQVKTLDKATMLADSIKDNYMIHSSAIRLFTSSSQPDTRALTGILQLNNVGDTKLVDYKRPSDDLTLIDVFTTSLTDHLESSINIVSSKPVLMMNPWDNPTNEINVFEGDNTFWVSEPDDVVFDMYINGSHIQTLMVDMKPQLDFTSFETVLKEKIDYYVKRMKVLKVLDMNSSKDEIKEIVKYFSQLEKTFIMNDKSEIDLSTDTSIKTRVKFLKKMALRQSKSIVQILSSIANQDKVSQLNSAQQADYLKSTTTSSNAINLAKRALKQGFDFDEKAIKEVKEMRAHLHELDDIDDTNHSRSFYSMETTLGGIRELCSLDDESLDNLGALEILQILNIVGIPCDAVIGDFPDPKTYHMNDFMPGACISMSDILMVRQLGHKLIHPFTKKTFVNSIPFYDDDRIQQFLIKYAPNLLEYTAGLGMRNIIANVPHTYKYTIVDGLWWMIRELQNNPTEGNARLFIKYVHTYKTAVGGLFSYVIDLIKPMSEEDKSNNLSLYIGNNGVTNMLGPLIALQAYPEKMKMMPDILRALYTFEFYQVMRKFYRQDADGYIKRKQMLDNLLGIDFNKYATPLPRLFETQRMPEHYGGYHIDKKIFEDITKRVFWIDYLCQAPIMIKYALNNDYESLLTLESVNDSHMIERALGISFSLEKFKLFCMYQGLMYDTMASRYDDQTEKMKIEDGGDEKRIDHHLSDYIKRQYYSHYQSELAKQNKEENEKLLMVLVDTMVKSNTIERFNELFREGMARNHVHVAITDSYKAGFDDLKTKLFDPSVDCPMREAKLKVLILGQDSEERVVYNKGNTYRTSLPTLEKLFDNVELQDLWKSIKSVYIAKSIHQYRENDTPNRHSHCNSKPSYWAYGFKNLGEYFKTISKEEQNEYCKIHTHCCGVWDGKPYRWA